MIEHLTNSFYKANINLIPKPKTILKKKTTGQYPLRILMQKTFKKY